MARLGETMMTEFLKRPWLGVLFFGGVGGWIGYDAWKDGKKDGMIFGAVMGGMGLVFLLAPNLMRNLFDFKEEEPPASGSLQRIPCRSESCATEYPLNMPQCPDCGTPRSESAT